MWKALSVADRARFLQALIDGPVFRTLQVNGRYSLDTEVWKTMAASRHREWEERHPGARRSMLVSVGEALDADGDPERWAAVVDVSGPVRHRLVTSGLTSVSDGVTVTTVSRERAFVRDATADEHVGPPLGDVMDPLFLVVSYEIGEAVEATHLGRACVSVTASQRPPSDRVERPVRYEFGDRARIVMDLATGLIVKWQSWFDGTELGDFCIDEMEVDQPVTSEVFAVEVPEGVAVHTIGDPETERAKARRIVRESGRFTPPRPPSLADRLADYMPRGEPPANPAAAEAEIRAAVEGLSHLSDDGEDAVNVHGGAGLGAAFREAATRQPRDIRFVLDGARFLGPEEAAIAFHIEGDLFMTFEGRALHVDSRWLLERRTVTGLLRLAGATIPPPPLD